MHHTLFLVLTTLVSTVFIQTTEVCVIDPLLCFFPVHHLHPSLVSFICELPFAGCDSWCHVFGICTTSELHLSLLNQPCSEASWTIKNKRGARMKVRLVEHQVWHAAKAGWKMMCSKRLFSQSQHSVQTLLQCLHSPCAQSDTSTSMCMSNSQVLAAIPLFGHSKIQPILAQSLKTQCSSCLEDRGMENSHVCSLSLKKPRCTTFIKTWMQKKKPIRNAKSHNVLASVSKKFWRP